MPLACHAPIVFQFDVNVVGELFRFARPDSVDIKSMQELTHPIRVTIHRLPNRQEPCIYIATNLLDEPIDHLLRLGGILRLLKLADHHEIRRVL